MRTVPAIAAEKATPKSLILAQRKIVCVVLDHDDMDKLTDRKCITVNLEEHFSELPKSSVVLAFHDSEPEAIRAFKEAFDLVYLDGRKM